MKSKKLKVAITTWWIKKKVSEKEIQDAANEMKGDKAYLFKDTEGFLYIYNKRRLNEFQARDKTFIKKLNVTK